MTDDFGVSAVIAASGTQGGSGKNAMNYTDADIRGDWEFKILDNWCGAFGKREVLKKVCEEEAMAGWQLLEKIDNGHLRFKRNTSCRTNDATLELDPYRTTYGASNAQQVAVILAVLFLGLPLLAVVIVALVNVFR